MLAKILTIIIQKPIKSKYSEFMSPTSQNAKLAVNFDQKIISIAVAFAAWLLSP